MPLTDALYRVSYNLPAPRISPRSSTYWQPQHFDQMSSNKARRLRSASDFCDRPVPALATSRPPPQDVRPTHRCRLTPPLPNPLPPGPTLPPVLVPANLPASGAFRVPELDGALDFACDLGGADEVGCAPQEGNIFFIVYAIRSKTSGLRFSDGPETAIGD